LSAVVDAAIWIFIWQGNKFIACPRPGLARQRETTEVVAKSGEKKNDSAYVIG
jgi:hypothetical protein